MVFVSGLTPAGVKDNRSKESNDFLSLFASLLWMTRCTRWDILAPLMIVPQASCNPPKLPAPEWVRRHGSGMLAVMRHRNINKKALDSVRRAHGEDDP